MPYVSKQEMIDQLGEPELIELTDKSSAGVIDDTELNHAMSKASQRIENALSDAGYTAQEQDAELRGYALDIAHYLLFRVPNDAETEKFNAATRELNLIALRKRGGRFADTSLGTAGMPDFVTPDPIMGSGGLKDY